MNWHDYLAYDTETGNLVWKSRTASTFPNTHKMASWNAKYSGRVAGTLSKVGYVFVVVNYRSYYAHRIIWEMYYGPIPSKRLIDHIDGTKSHNKLCNLRLATSSENAANSSRSKANKSGMKGVYWGSINKKWRAEIRVNGKRLTLGRHDALTEAHKAYYTAAKRHFGEFARTS